MNQQELHIKETLPALSFNYDQLKEWAHGLTARYADMVVTEDSVADVKRDMAELNKNKAKLETARKETVRRLSEPIKSFEAQVKEVVGIFDAAYAGLSGQVKAFEDAQREEKRKTVNGIIKEECAAAYGEGPWLNIPSKMTAEEKQLPLEKKAKPDQPPADTAPADEAEGADLPEEKGCETCTHSDGDGATDCPECSACDEDTFSSWEKAEKACALCSHLDTDDDEINACEGCDDHLSNFTPLSVTQEQPASAGAVQ